MSDGSRRHGMFLTFGLVAAALTFFVAVLDESRNFDNPLPLVVLGAGAALFVGLVRSPIGRAIARMLDDENLPDEHLALRVEELEARLSELTLEQSRVMELEGRVDFVERVMTRPLEEGRREPS